MSTIKHPVGPQSQSVYWRRRLVVLLGALAVIVVIVLIIVRPGAADAQKPDAGAGSSGTAGSASPTPDSAGSTPVASDGSAACVPAAIRVEAVTDTADYTAEQQPALSLVVTNTGATPCTLNVGTAAQVFTVKSGDDVYWTSTDCQTDAGDAPFVLPPGEPVTSAAPIMWDRTRSAPETCDAAERDSAPADGASYHLSVSVDGIESASSRQFILN